MNLKKTNWDFIFYATLGVLIILSGVYMIANDKVAVGIHAQTLQPSGFGGELIIFVGLVFLFVAYFSLSPFSKIREFLEGRKKKKE